jgi:hypothetical protein
MTERQITWNVRDGKVQSMMVEENVAVENMPTFSTKPGHDTEGHVFYIERGEGFKPHVHVEKGNKIAKFWLDEPKERAVKDRGTMNNSELAEAWKHVYRTPLSFALFNVE